MFFYVKLWSALIYTDLQDRDRKAAKEKKNCKRVTQKIKYL